jgi:hypothetical protein
MNAKQTRNPPLVRERGLCSWVGRAHSGDSFVYHRGWLARDRSSTASALPALAREELSRVARRAMALEQDGFADLAQRRLGPDDYEYLITVRLRPRRDGRVLADILAAELSIAAEIEGDQE